MLEFQSYRLANGLKIIVHQDCSTELAACNLIYNVGAKLESPDRTGFAHLFEHLMFGGSVNIPDFDNPLQLVGGESNAFTNNDYTNYYITLPHQNLETAFWLESDRMLSLDFSQKNLDTQKKVVIEEFNQRYLNQPYGDLWLLLRPLAYKQHPYRWPTIGREISHIAEADLTQVASFYETHYCPGNAILSVTGKVDPDAVFRMAEHWFGQIHRVHQPPPTIPSEPVPTKPTFLEVKRPVPQDVIYMAFHMDGRHSEDFYRGDVLSDILASGNSSRLVDQLVKERELFTEVNAYITGDIDPGLFIVMGKPRAGITLSDAQSYLEEQLSIMRDKSISERELTKVLNKTEANFTYGQTSILNKAMNLGYFELFDQAGRINQELDHYKKLRPVDIQKFAQSVLDFNKVSVLHYIAENNG